MVKINNGGIMFRERGELQLLPAQFYEIKRLRNSNCVYDERMMINITFYSFNITVSYLFFFQEIHNKNILSTSEFHFVNHSLITNYPITFRNKEINTFRILIHLPSFEKLPPLFAGTKGRGFVQIPGIKIPERNSSS